MSEKGGLSLRGGAFMAALAVLESTLSSLSLSYKIQHKEATVTVLTVLAFSSQVRRKHGNDIPW